MEKAVADAYAKGFLDKNIFGSDTEFQIITQSGAGAYEVGEESALMESLEGKRGVPRIKPPFPAVVGLYGGPTVINNAETIATVPHVITMGGAAFAALGSPPHRRRRRCSRRPQPQGRRSRRILHTRPAPRRDREPRHGLRSGRQGRIHARLRRRRRPRRPDLHLRIRSPHHQL